MLTKTVLVIVEDAAKKICIALLLIDSILIGQQMCHVLMNRCFTLPLAQNQFPPMGHHFLYKACIVE